MHSLVHTSRGGADIVLYELGQLHRVLHILVLHVLEHDVRLGGVGVESLIARLIVRLERDYGVLALGHVEVVSGAVHTQGVHLKALDRLSLRHGIRVDRYEQVRLRAVGDVRPSLQGDELVSLARVDDIDVRTVLLNIPAEGQRHLEVDVLLLRDGSNRAGVASAMARIYHQGEFLVGRHEACVHEVRGEKQKRSNQRHGSHRSADAAPYGMSMPSACINYV